MSKRNVRRNIRTIFLETEKIEPSKELSPRDNSEISIDFIYKGVIVRVLLSFGGPLFYEHEIEKILGESVKGKFVNFRINDRYRRSYNIKTFDEEGKEKNIPLIGYSVIKVACKLSNNDFIHILKEIKVKSSIWYRNLYFKS